MLAKNYDRCQTRRELLRRYATKDDYGRTYALSIAMEAYWESLK